MSAVRPNLQKVLTNCITEKTVSSFPSGLRDEVKETHIDSNSDEIFSIRGNPLDAAFPLAPRKNP